LPTMPSDTADVLHFLAVIVVYKRLPADTPTLQTLLEAKRVASSPTFQLSIFIADNTPGGQDPGTLPEGVSYRAAPDNPGLARPYNEAIVTAGQEGCSWLLTLDQDTHLPPDFLLLLERYARQYRKVDQVAAIVPQIADNGRIISPFRYVGGFLPRVLPSGTKGISGRHTSALNSASLLRVSALRQIGGYDPRLPLHNSDTRLYQHLDEAGKRVVVAGDIFVNHELAILQRQNRMTAERYRQMLADECDFWDRHMGLLGRTERLIRLLGRVCKGYLQGEDAMFRKVTLDEIRRRLLTRRSARLQAGEQVVGWKG
jgi:GT2 family glycosyltransferase